MSFLKKISSLFVDDDNEISDKHILVLDIGTDLVKALIFNIEQEKEGGRAKVVILGAGTENIKTDKIIFENLEELIKACQIAKKEAENMAGFRTKQAIIGMAGQFIKVATNLINFSREKSARRIDLAEVKNLIQKAQWKIFEQLRQKEAQECGTAEIETKLINGKIISIKIDGYSVVDPLGFQGKELTFNILNNYTSFECLNFLQQIKKTLRLENFLIVAQPYTVLNAILESVFKATSFNEVACILIDCGARTTDVSVCNQDFFSGPKTINFGGRSFTKRLMTKFNLKEEEAEELKLKYSAGQVSMQVKRKITDIFKTDLKIWLKGIEMVLTDFSSIENFPSLILFTGGGSLLPGIKKIIESEEWQKNFNFLQPVRTRIIKIDDISGVDERTGLLNEAQNIPSLALAIFGLKLIKKESEIDSILSRAIRLMQT